MVSFRKKELVISRKNYKYSGTFLQPLAVAIVSAVLVALILIMGFLPQGIAGGLRAAMAYARQRRGQHE